MPTFARTLPPLLWQAQGHHAKISNMTATTPSSIAAHGGTKIKSPATSINKLELELNEFQVIIDNAFHSDGRQVVGYKEHADNRFSSLYLVNLQDGGKVVIKFAPRPDVRVLHHERDLIPSDYGIVTLIKERTSVPVPIVIRHDSSGEIIEAPYTVMEYIPGLTLSYHRDRFSVETLASIDLTLGQYVREINAIEGDHFGLCPKTAKRYDTWRDAFLAMLEAVLRDAEDTTILLPYDLIRQHIHRAAYTLDDVTVPQLVPYDAGDNHLIVDETGQVQTMFNFERAVWGDPLMECAFEDPSGAFLEGYGEDLRAGSRNQARRSMYSIYFYLVKVTSGFYRQIHDGEMRYRKGLIYHLEKLIKWKEE